MLDFQLFCTHCVALQAMNSARRSALANNAAMMSCTQAITLMLHIVTYSTQRRTKVSFGRTMMQSIATAVVGKKTHHLMKQRH